MDAPDYRQVVAERAPVLLQAAGQDLQAPLPSCPGWVAKDLVVHITRVWGWAAHILRTGERTNLPEVPDDLGDQALLEWGAERIEELDRALAAADPDANCWTFGLPRSCLFWFRRQAMEVTVHCWDVQRAFGEPEVIPPEVASDGIDEFAGMILPRIVKGQPEQWQGESLHLHGTDGEGEWLITLGPGGESKVEHAHGKGDVALRGTASDLYLWTVGRAPLSAFEVFGDAGLAERWSGEIAF